ncbi:MAG TPA: AAA family ATPase [Thermoanaerobaculia bacterium]|nr:AAA family ATPase [Thermoanaerobaculia bacterium]
MSRQTSVHDLERLLQSFHTLIAVETVEEERVRSILMEVATRLTVPLFEWSLHGGLKRRIGNEMEGTKDPLSMLQRIEEIHSGDAIYLLKDLGPHLGNANVARVLRELVTRIHSSRSAIVITGEPIELPRDIESLAVRFELLLPDEREIREVVRQVIDSMTTRRRVHVDLSRDDAMRLVRSLAGLTLNQVRRVIAQAIVADDRLSGEDIDRVVRWKGEIIERGGLLEFFPLEGNTFELGGFDRLKAWLERARIGFSREARALNLAPPKGVLFVGVQGCGKSLAAKFIAREWKLPLLKLDAGRLYDKYVGESEKNFRRATTVAEAMAPVVLWIDELEKAFGQGGSNDADGGLSQRLFGALLTWLQEKKEEVFVIGSANDLSRLPPEFLRKGRFDEIFFVDLPVEEERRNIFSIHLRLRKQDPARFDLERLAAATEGFSGAEIEQAVISALYRALHVKRGLTTEKILDAVKSTVPLSVTRSEDISRLRAAAEGRFTPVR